MVCSTFCCRIRCLAAAKRSGWKSLDFHAEYANVEAKLGQAVSVPKQTQNICDWIWFRRCLAQMHTFAYHILEQVSTKIHPSGCQHLNRTWAQDHNEAWENLLKTLQVRERASISAPNINVGIKHLYQTTLSRAIQGMGTIFICGSEATSGTTMTMTAIYQRVAHSVCDKFYSLATASENKIAKLYENGWAVKLSKQGQASSSGSRSASPQMKRET